MKIVCLVNGGTTSLDGKYLKEYNPSKNGTGPNGEPMIAHIVVTENKEDALKFKNLEDLHAVWTLVDQRKPIRDDGRPNRPLTAFSVMPVKLY